MQKLFRILSALILTCVVLLGVATIYLTRTLDVDVVADTVEEAVSSAIGLSCRLRGAPPLRIGIWPVLSVQADNVVLQTLPDDYGVMHDVVGVGRVSATMELFPLLFGHLEIDRIQLKNPVINLAYADSIAGLFSSSKESGPSLQEHSAQDLAVDASASPSGLQGVLERFSVDGLDIENGVIEYRTTTMSEAEVLSVTGVRVTLDAYGNMPWIVEANAQYGRTSLRITASGAAERKDEKFSAMRAVVDIKGELDLNNHLMPVLVNATPVFIPGSNTLNIPTLKVRLADLGLDGQMLVTDAVSERWNGTGDVRLSHLSLPYWFGFTKNLPSSLNHALDDLGGRIKFAINAKGVWAHDLTAEVLGMPLHGSGGVPDFSHPAIIIDAEGDMIDVDKIFPEISEVPPAVLPLPKSSGRPVLSDDPDAQVASSEAEDEGWGYDIRVRARNGTARGLTFKGLSFRCGPTEDNEATYTSYDIDEFYGGNLKSLLTFRDEMSLDLDITNVSSDEPVRILFKEEILGGVLNGKAHLASGASSVFGLIASMHGSIEASIEDGYVGTAGKRTASGDQPLLKFPMKQMNLMLKGHGKGSDQTVSEDLWPYYWNGELTYSLPDSSDEYLFALDGPVWVETPGGMPVRVRDAKFRFFSHKLMKPFDKKVHIAKDLSGILTCDLDAETLQITGMTGNVAGAQVAMDVAATQLYGDTRWKGNGSVAVVSLETFLSELGLSLWERKDPSTMKAASVAGDFSLVYEVLELSNLIASFDDTTMRGGLTCTRGDKPIWRFATSGDMLNLDRYLPPSQKGKEKKTPATPWELDWLKRMNAAGEIGVDSLLFRKLEIDDLRATIEIQDGTIKALPVSASFYGGTVNGTYKAQVVDGLKSDIKLSMSGVNLDPAASVVFGDDYVGGVASAYFDAGGVFRSADDWPAAFNGVWGFEIEDGYYRLASSKKEAKSEKADSEKKDKNSSPKQGVILQQDGDTPIKRDTFLRGVDKNDPEKSERRRSRKNRDGRSSFSNATADGEISNGVIRNENLSLSSLLVSMEGKGEINMVKETVDYTVTVTYAQVPTFPVRIYGDLNSPETTVKQGQILPKTLTKLGGSIFSIFKGVITAPFWLVDTVGDVVTGGSSEEDNR